MGDDRLCHAAHDQPRETGPAVRPDDDQIRVPFIRVVDDGRSWIALGDGRFDGQSRRGKAFACLTHELLGTLCLTLPNLFERR